MPKFDYERISESPTAFIERRQLRRIRMIVELTLNLISSDRTASYREARSLVACARKAILEIFPGFDAQYEQVVRPHFDRVLQIRWPDEELRIFDGDQLVN